MMYKLWLLICLIAGPAGLMAAEPNLLSTPSMQQDYEALTQELRCPKCQNQNLAGSDSQISKSMKSLIKQQLEAGQSPEQIKQGLISRYGEFISYKPPYNRQTFVLWFFPPLLLGVFLLIWLVRYKRVGHSVSLTQDQRDQIERLIDTESERKTGDQP